MTTEDLEGTLSLCYQHLVQSLLTRLFRGDFKIDFSRSCMHATTEQNPKDHRTFTTLLQGHFQIVNGAGHEFRVHWGATGAKLVSSGKPTSSPSLWLQVAEGNPSTLDDDDEVLWEKRKFLDLKFNRPLPNYIFSMEGAEDLTNSVIHGEVWLENVSDGYHRALFEERGRFDNVTIPLRELSQCLQFGLASQFEHRLMQGEAFRAK